MKNKIGKAIMVLTAAGFMGAAGGGRAVAGVVGSSHDLSSSSSSNNTCSYCHVPHKAMGDKIWSSYGNEAQLSNPNYSEIGRMCYTCHDGTVTNKGQNTVFNTSLQQHKVSSGKDCDMCHTVHDNTNGKFLGVQKTGGAQTEAASYCETCHGTTPHSDAVSLGDHLAGTEHPYKDSGSLLDKGCESCHAVHGAANYAPSSGTITHPILRKTNANSAYCAECHSTHVQATSNGNKHPANLSAGGAWGKVTCQDCHDVHQPDETDHPAILKSENSDSSYCMTCHQAAGAAKGPDIGDHSHPNGAAFSLTPTDSSRTPAANAIDDDDQNGADYSNNTNSVVCESCHSVHQKGVASPLLRMTDDAGTLCINCHNDK